MGAGIDLLSRDVWRGERGEEDGEEKDVETRRDVHARILCATGGLVEFSASQARGGDGVLVESGSRWRCWGTRGDEKYGAEDFCDGIGGGGVGRDGAGWHGVWTERERAGRRRERGAEQESR